MKDKNINFDYLLFDYKQCLLEKNERKEFYILDKYLKNFPFHQLDVEMQIRYCHLLKLRGAVGQSIRLLERRIKELSPKIHADFRYELICAYLYVGDYDKAEKQLMDWFYTRKENKKKPLLATVANEIQLSKFSVAAFEIARKKNYPFPYVKHSNGTNYMNQLMHYDLNYMKRYILRYFGKTEDYNQFNQNLNVDKVTVMAEKLLEHAEKSTDSMAVDFYYFDLEQKIGKDINGQDLTGIKVTTIKDTNHIVNIEPIDVKDETKIRIINHDATTIKENNTSNKVYQKSQIEKFNRRYNRS